MKTQSDMMVASRSALRKEITLCNKALKGSVSHPNGMTPLVVEDIKHKLELIKAELRSRARWR